MNPVGSPRVSRSESCSHAGEYLMGVGTIVVALLAAIALCAVVPAAHAGCTYDQAVQKMTAVANGLGQKLAQAKT